MDDDQNKNTTDSDGAVQPDDALKDGFVSEDEYGAKGTMPPTGPMKNEEEIEAEHMVNDENSGAGELSTDELPKNPGESDLDAAKES